MAPVFRGAWRLPTGGRVTEFGKDAFDRRLQVAWSGEQAEMIQYPLHQPCPVRADAGHGFQPRKVRIGKPVRQVAERPVPRCGEALPQTGRQDGLADRQVAIRRLAVRRKQPRPCPLFPLQRPANMAELAGREAELATDLAIGSTGSPQITRLLQIQDRLFGLTQHG